MPTTEQLRNRLLKKLKELFQLDQPDLDFGFYRIMHAKARQVSEFIDNDLLGIVEEAFGQTDQAHKEALKARIDEAIETAKKFGAPDPEQTEPVKEARRRYEAAADSASAEADIYDHLYRFFERYYDDGDFISRRYYARETPGRAAPFAIPYNGEEVKLHWANADQYYIKTSEYFNTFTFNLSHAARTQMERNLKEKEGDKGGFFGITAKDVPDGLRVHFRVVEATEGEHGNIKATDATKRYFIIHKEKPVETNAAGELTINFEYRPDPEKTGQEGTWREKRNAEAVETILSYLKSRAGEDDGSDVFLRFLTIPSPTESDRKRPLLAKYINQYTARNTKDYFIHKDLGGFLRRELDFYIKNEVMHLDDIENADAPAAESYLSKIKVLRKIAGKLIDFLAQLEDFQKKLWLKKKFVVETNYCITLDRIPEELYPEIAANEAQHDEWVRLFAIDEIKGDLAGPGYSRPLTVGFLKANDKLVVDTRFFSDEWKTRLIGTIEGLDEKCDGLMIQSENSQALSFLDLRYGKQIEYVYIDPPYNTNEAAFVYKNEYKHSSWATMVSNSVSRSLKLLKGTGVLSAAIDDLEQPTLVHVLDVLFGMDNRLGTLVVETKPSGRTNDNFLATCHEYLQFYGVSPTGTDIGFFELTDEQKAQYAETDSNGAHKWRDFLRTGGYSTPEERPNSFYPVYYDRDTGEITLEEKTSFIRILPIDSEGKRRVWRKTPVSFMKHLDAKEIRVVENRSGQWKVQIIDRIKEGVRPKSVWVGKAYDAASHGTKLLKSMFGNTSPFTFPKSLYSVRDAIRIVTGNLEVGCTILDYFAGSGTTGHAAISLNREDEIHRRYILVEIGNHFYTALKPRIQRAVYSEVWKGGKPTSRESGISHCFKYLRLESYEDTLNNLRFDENPVRAETIAGSSSLKEDYMLHYLLDVETRGSQSLLNIDAFTDPTAYTLKVKKPGSDEYVERAVDLFETFNYLIGLRVIHIAQPQTFNAVFTRLFDPELPEDQHTRLVLEGKLSQDPTGPWWFRKVEGWVPGDRQNPNNGQREKVLIVWRKLTGDLEKDNLILDEWFEKNRISTRDFEFDTIYVNGSNNLPNLLKEGDTWKVRLIEEEFMKRMWDTGEI